MKSLFNLHADVSFFNHASLGLCPKTILQKSYDISLISELNPLKFYDRDLLYQIETCQKGLGEFLNINYKNILLVENATFAANIILQSLTFKKNDRILISSHEYGAFNRLFKLLEYKFKVILDIVNIPIEMVLQKDIYSKVTSLIKPATKAIFISHVSYINGSIFPIKKICTYAKKQGILTIIDGSQAVGNINVDISKIDPDIYFASCHKWLFTARPTGFVYANKNVQKLFKPLVYSWGKNSPQVKNNSFFDEFTWLGTRDFTKILTINDSINFHKKYLNQSIKNICRETLFKTLKILCDTINSKSFYFNLEEFGLFASFPLPDCNIKKLTEKLIIKKKIEIKISRFEKTNYIRICMLPYVDDNDISRLKNSLKEFFC